MLDFLGIGAQKAGTTWIYENLAKHPDIIFPNGKEVHFWDKINISNKTEIDKYVESFSSELSDNKDDKKQGEITPAYAFLDKEIIKEIYNINPDLRIIYSIRNPIQRAWSGALMALRRSEMTIDEASDNWFLDHFKSKGSLQRGDYEKCIDNWNEVFPKENFLIINFDDIANNPREVLRKCADHIGVSVEKINNIKDDILTTKIYSGLEHPNRPKLEKKLVKIYKNKIESGKNHPLLKDVFKDF